ncbi:TetR/AcrR family transcriptional regulator [Streptomyces sp. NPDC090499]|uniref:TetR/AcrR family transcriptional regulator n=1 Tax=Streptomyces sp. NPDC090499 TaxID=3365965 RepID=UPI003825B39A
MDDGKTPTRKRNTRGEGSRLREEIIRAAFTVLREEGSIEAVGLRPVARAAGITAPSIYPHFATVEDLLAVMREAIFAQVRDITRRAAKDTGSAALALYARAGAYVRIWVSQPAWRQLMFTAIPGHSQEAGEAAFADLVKALEECVLEGTSVSDDPRTDAAHLISALHGLVLSRTVMSAFPWPPLEKSIGDITQRIARLSVRSDVCDAP